MIINGLNKFLPENKTYLTLRVILFAVCLISVIELLLYSVKNVYWLSIHPSIAISFLIAASAIWLQAQPKNNFTKYYVYTAAAIIILINFVNIIIFWQFSRNDIYNYSLHLAPLTSAYNLLFLALAIALVDIKIYKVWPSELFSLTILCTCLITLLCYLYNVHAIVFLKRYIAMPFSTGFCLFLLSFTILMLRPNYGITSILFKKDMVAYSFRHELVFILLSPIVAGFIIKQQILPNTEVSRYSVTLLTLSSIIMLFFILLINISLLNRETKKHKQREFHFRSDLDLSKSEKLALQEKFKTKCLEIDAIINHLPNTVIFWKDKEGKFLGCNNALPQSIGFNDPSDIIGKTDYDLPWTKEESDHYRADDLAVMRMGTAKINIEETQTLADGTLLHLLTNKVPLYDDSKNIIGVLGIYFDITERRQMELNLLQTHKELQKTIAKLQAANETRNKFLASINHELRTPLNAIIGFTGLLLMKCTGDLSKTQEKHLNIIKRSSKHLLTLINELLYISKLESGKVEVRHEKFILQKVIEEAYEMLIPIAEAKNLEFKTSMPPEEIIVSSDKKILLQIIINLVHNAIKFTEQGTVNVKLSINKNNILISVVDTGVGISPQDMKRLFQEFTQLDARSKNDSSTGLGLYLSRKLCYLIKGRIEVQTEHGNGSVFTLLLPVTISVHLNKDLIEA